MSEREELIQPTSALPFDVMLNPNSSPQQADYSSLPRRGINHYAAIDSALPIGLAAMKIRVEVSLHQGLPYFELVGIPASQAQAVKSRVTAAIKNSGFQFPDQRIIASVSSETLYTQAFGLDLPLALALLQASGQVKIPDLLTCTGQLNLVGEIVSLPSVYNVFNALAGSGCRLIVSGRCNGREAAEVPANFHLASNLREVCASLNQAKSWQDLAVTDLSIYQSSGTKAIELPQMAELPAQYMARYALMIAAAGRHHLLMLGGAGCGKTSLARMLPFILPELSDVERRTVLSIYSAGGQPLDERITSNLAPFRQPHFEISQAALIGGGSNLLPGEISLAHHGVLFLDELNEFQSVNLNALRSVLSDAQIALARNRRKDILPADFIMLAACNPCPCGNYLEAELNCRCKIHQIRNKLGKLKGPFGDRIDLFVELKRIPKDELMRTIEEGYLCDITDMKTRVADAILIQADRFRSLHKADVRNSNIQSSKLMQFFRIEKDALRMAEKLAQSHLLSVRGFHKLLRVARTIADLDQSESVRTGHVSMAAQFRAKSYLWSEGEE